MTTKSILLLSLMLICLAGSLSGAQAGPDPAPLAALDLGNPEQFRRELTLRFVAQLRDPALRELLASRLDAGQTRISLKHLVRDWAELWPSPDRQRFAALVAGLDLDLRSEMGIQRNTRDILDLEVVWPEGGPRPMAWDGALFAVRPLAADTPPTVEAYDLQGRPQALDPLIRPAVPVLMLGADRREVVRAGLEAVNQGLERAGFSSFRGDEPTGPIATAQLTHIRLAPGQESWWRSGLTVYALVSGIDPLQDKPNIRLVNLPYLRHEATDYYPNQVILFWSDFRFAAANIQFFDHRDGTDYQQLLGALLQAVAAAMAVGGAPAFTWIPQLANAIIQAMPSSWWKDTDVWLDTFYTLERDLSYLERTGSASAVTLSLVPWQLKPQ